jgi:ribosomal protein RSM22 (predicted rRNA methylase)
MTGTVAAVLDDVAIDSSRKGVVMLDVCDQCGSSVSKRLLRCSDGTAVFHRECTNGHKLHRTTGEKDQQKVDSHRAATSYVIIEACDCH